MAIDLMTLPYAPGTLEPVVSAETLALHHGKHHRAYVKKTNDAIAGSDLADASLEAIVNAARKANDAKLFNNSAQVWNHGFYWHSLTPDTSEPSAALAKAIAAEFGALPKLIDAIVELGVGHFASGWVWLVRDGSALKLIDTHDAETAVGQPWVPLLVIDVWEHAHYVDYRNDREAYLKAVTSKQLNWHFASKNFDRNDLWIYG